MKNDKVSRPRVRASERSDYRRGYPKFDADARKYGLEVAIHNSGFVRGDDNGRLKLAQAVMPALQLLSVALAGHGHKWTYRQRRALNKAMLHAERGLAREKKK